METTQDIESKRADILKQISSIRSMKRGTINEQYLKVRQKGKDEPVLRGPYYVLSKREGGKTVSERLTSPEMLKQAKADVAAHKRFVELCKEYELLTEKLGEIERKYGSGEEKKRPKSQSKKKRK